ncbi:SH3 domain-containing protein [Bacillus cereus group sp. BfR-BA-01380]|uniref:SH3 domain-containing protein n=1 Tax=Bacillus cereus group sp. BfR-BA-01380 TaxID=2920324 RepID=UPI001F57BDB9|nr:SH3 domain-containing protein [Bacillus cereus group sp. BfR-BA-01380]
MKRTTKQIIAGTFIATAASLISTNAFAQEESTATVNATNLHIRQQPTTQSPIVGQVKQGTPVKVLGVQKDWAKISYNGKEGYVLLRFLKIAGTTTTIESKQQPSINNGQREMGFVTAIYLNVRNSPDVGSTLLGSVEKGESVTIIGKANGWAKIEYKGKEGYVSLKFVKLEGKAVEKPTENVVTGKQEEGTITASSLRVRSGANRNSAILGNLKQGEKITVLGKENGWAKVAYKGKEGYVSLEFVQINTSSNTNNENNGQVTEERGIVNTSFLNVRQGPSTNTSIVTCLKNGESVSVLGKENGWAKVRVNGVEGYVLLKFVKLEGKLAENVMTGKQEKGTITATSLRVRSEANRNSAILGNLKQGEKITVLGKENGWAKIIYKGKEGYVSLEFVQINTSSNANNENNGQVTEERGIVNTSFLNVRQGPSTNTSIMTCLKNGESVSILGKENGWAKVRVNGVEGYVSLKFVKLEGKPAENVVTGKQEEGTITATSLRVRSAANTNSAILGNLKQGEKITVLGKENGWAKIMYKGKEGYVSLEFVKLEGKPAENVVTGKQEEGTITATSLRVRSEANRNSAILGNLKQGEKITVLGKENGWAKITYKGKEGYVSLEFVQISTSSNANNENNGQVTEERGIVNTSLLNVRQGPSTNTSIVTRLKNGESVSILGKENGWAKVRINGVEGYVSLQFLKLKQASSYEVVTEAGKVQKSNGMEAEKELQTKQEDGYIVSDGKVVNMKQGFVRTNGVINIYDITTGKKLTYVREGADLKFVKVDGDRVHVKIHGTTGYVNIDDVTLFPNMLHESTSYYTVKNGSLYHYVYDNSKDEYVTYKIGNAPRHLQEGQRYEAFDKTQIGGQDSYQYFEYVPIRVTSTYTAKDIDDFVRKHSEDSPLIGTGQYFVKAEQKYNLNAGYLLSHAILESGWGKSRIAQDKKNLFGFRAVDSNPYNGATAFKTWEEGINFCASYIDQNYLNPNGWTYNGGNLGDKSQGMNVMYASDENWGQQIASLMNRLDAMNGGKDLNKYQLGMLQEGSVLFENIDGEQVSVAPRNITVAIKNTIQTSNGTFYELVSDNTAYNSVYAKASSVKLISSY